jgi:hypothetical protein
MNKGKVSHGWKNARAWWIGGEYFVEMQAKLGVTTSLALILRAMGRL